MSNGLSFLVHSIKLILFIEIVLMYPIEYRYFIRIISCGSFSFGHSVVNFSSIYGFILLTPFGIFKFFSQNVILTSRKVSCFSTLHRQIENMGANGGPVTAFISRALNLSVLRVAQSLVLFSI